MTSPTSFPCLFCKHTNPSDATFCMGCGSQLNLQPCHQCDAIDSRAAVNCHKCGAPFTAMAARKLEPVPVPSSADHHVVHSRANQHTPELSHWGRDLICTAVDLPVQAEEPETPTKARSEPPRHRWLLSVAATFLALMAVSTFAYYRSPEKRPPPMAADMSAESAAAIPPMVLPDQPGSGPVELEKLAAIAPPDNTAAVPMHLSAVTTATVKNQPEPSALNACSEAVATLGLCSSVSKQGNP